MSGKHISVGVVLFMVCWIVHYGYDHASHELRWHAWNMGGAFGRLLLLALVLIAWPGPATFAAAAWWAAEEVQVVGCGVAYALKPWPVAPGEDLCSSWVGVPPLALVGLLVAAAGAFRFYRLTRQHDPTQ